MLDPAYLEEILDVMHEKGATHLSTPEFTVTLGAAPAPAEREDMGEAIKEATRLERMPSAARGLFGHPSLWPNGRPPTFPGAERATPQHKPTHEDEE